MYKIFYTNNFKKQVSRIIFSGKCPRDRISYVINTIASNTLIDQSLKNHKLHGEYSGFYECHIRPDVLLIYTKDNENNMIICAAIGSHSELFG